MITMTEAAPVAAGPDDDAVNTARVRLTEAWASLCAGSNLTLPDDDETLIRHLIDKERRAGREVIADVKVLLTRVRAVRRAERIQRFQADVRLPKLLLQLYLDDEIMTTRDVLQARQMNAPRLSLLRGKTRELGHDDHPGAFLDPDVLMGNVYNRLDPGVERGRWREWLRTTGRAVWNPEVEALVASDRMRHGRAPMPSPED